jgi:hypothetical protein
MNLNWLKSKRIFLVVLGAVFLFGFSGCLTPQFTYQGRLTDQNGNPIDGTVSIKYKFYNDATAGKLLYTETHSSVNLSEDGLFNSVVGPTAPGDDLSAKDLSQPLWIEVEVGNGVITETLSPRQLLYGAPYAFTLMPGAVISNTFGTILAGSSGAESIASIYNTFDTSGSNYALPALKLYGERGLQLSGFTEDRGNPANGEAGTIYSAYSNDSDLLFYSSDEIWFFLDYDQASDSSVSTFKIFNGDGDVVWKVDENGNHLAATFQSPVNTSQGEVILQSVQSPEAWFEDFGSSELKDGAVTVSIDSLFAQTVNLNIDYHVFLTPLGDCNGLYVTNKTATGFEVRELGGGGSNINFDYRIVARRSGYENTRLESAETLSNTEDKYP